MKLYHRILASSHSSSKIHSDYETLVNTHEESSSLFTPQPQRRLSSYLPPVRGSEYCQRNRPHNVRKPVNANIKYYFYWSDPKEIVDRLRLLWA